MYSLFALCILYSLSVFSICINKKIKVDRKSNTEADHQAVARKRSLIGINAVRIIYIYIHMSNPYKNPYVEYKPKLKRVVPPRPKEYLLTYQVLHFMMQNPKLLHK